MTVRVWVPPVPVVVEWTVVQVVASVEVWIWYARGVRRLPLQHHLTDVAHTAEIDAQPLRVGEQRRPSGARVAVERGRGRHARVLRARGGGRLVEGGVGGGVTGPGRRGRAEVAVDLELPQRVPVSGGAGGAVHPHVPSGAADRQRLHPAGAGGGRVDRRPVGRVGRGLDLERGGVRALPAQDHLRDGGRGAEVDPQPLGVRPLRAPARARVAVHGGRCRQVRALHGRGHRRPALRDQGVGRPGRGERHRDDGRGQGHHCDRHEHAPAPTLGHEFGEVATKRTNGSEPLHHDRDRLSTGRVRGAGESALQECLSVTPEFRACQ